MLDDNWMEMILAGWYFPTPGSTEYSRAYYSLIQAGTTGWKRLTDGDGCVCTAAPSCFENPETDFRATLYIYIVSPTSIKTEKVCMNRHIQRAANNVVLLPTYVFCTGFFRFFIAYCALGNMVRQRNKVQINTTKVALGTPQYVQTGSEEENSPEKNNIKTKPIQVGTTRRFEANSFIPGDGDFFSGLYFSLHRHG